MKHLGINKPRRIHVIGIEVENPYTISDSLSKRLEEGLDDIVEEVHNLIVNLVKENASIHDDSS